MRIAVTGGSGLVGRHLVAHLAPDHNVANLDIARPEKDLALEKKNLEQNP